MNNAKEATKNGYVYFYVSNESNNIVYFDNLPLVGHEHSTITEETHYYPYGLKMAGISSKAAGSLQNREKTFQNQLFDDDLGLNWVQFKWRNHDPQIGRFIEIDPLSDEYVYNSTYAFSENHVTVDVELEGLEKVPVNPFGTWDHPLPTGIDVIVSNAKKIPVLPPFKFPVNALLIPTVTQSIIWQKPAEVVAEKVGEKVGEEVAKQSLGYFLRTAGLTIVATVWPAQRPYFRDGDEFYYRKHPELIGLPVNAPQLRPINMYHYTPQQSPNPFTGHGNRRNNWNPHIIYEIYYTPPPGQSETLKYGISDVYRYSFDRPENQIAALRAKYGASVDWRLKLFAPNNAAARAAEQGFVDGHYLFYGAVPIEQDRPIPSILK